MKKSRRIILITAVLLIIIAGSVAIYAVRSPEYALLKISKDIKKCGMEGLYPHLTEDAKQTFDNIAALADSKFFGSILAFMDKKDYISVLKTELKEVKWGFDDLLKSKHKTKVVLSFDYKGKLSGTAEISMVRENGDWKISGLGLPEFDKIDL